MNDQYLYGELPAEVESAADVKGVLLRTLDGTMVVRFTPERARWVADERSAV